MATTGPADLPRRAGGVPPGTSAAAVASYGELRARVTDLLGGIDDADADRRVPACPDWTVTDTLAHLVGVCVDIVEGNLDGVATPEWADGHARRHRHLGIGGLLERWAGTAATIDSMGGLVPDETAAQFAFDATTHEQDIRGAIGRPGARDATSLHIGLGFLEQRLVDLVAARGLPPLQIVTATERIDIGDGPDPATLVASHFEAFRVFGGRRSRHQIDGLDWQGDAAGYLAVFDGGPLAPPETDLVE